MPSGTSGSVAAIASVGLAVEVAPHAARPPARGAGGSRPPRSRAGRRARSSASCSGRRDARRAGLSSLTPAARPRTALRRRRQAIGQLLGGAGPLGQSGRRSCRSCRACARADAAAQARFLVGRSARREASSSGEPECRKPGAALVGRGAADLELLAQRPAMATACSTSARLAAELLVRRPLSGGPRRARPQPTSTRAGACASRPRSRAARRELLRAYSEKRPALVRATQRDVDGCSAARRRGGQRLELVAPGAGRVRSATSSARRAAARRCRSISTCPAAASLASLGCAAPARGAASASAAGVTAETPGGPAAPRARPPRTVAFA